MIAPTTPAIRLVPLQETDLDQVATLANRALATYSHIFKGQRTSPQDYRDEAGDEARVFLGEDGGRLLATGMVASAERFIDIEQLGPAGTSRPGGGAQLPADDPWFGALYLGPVGVEPAIMNGGLGRLLVSHVESLARRAIGNSSLSTTSARW